MKHHFHPFAKRKALLCLFVFVLAFPFICSPSGSSSGTLPSLSSSLVAYGASEDQALRGVWVSSVKNLDYPSTPTTDTARLEKELEEKVPGIVSDFTAEEEEKIISGELSIEEAVKQKEQELEEKQKNTANSGSSGGSYSVDTKTNEIVSKKIIEFYSLKAYYLGQLGQLESQVIADYTALPDSKKNLVGKQEIASKYMSVATSLLSQCDARVDTLLKELEASIKEVDGDLSIITTIKNAYENEKNLKKSYYMSKLK